jgi:diguanylate cyclase (GGDEF)-like protein
MSDQALPEGSRRRGDSATPLIGRAVALLIGRLDAVRGGQVLLVATGICCAIAAPLLEPTARGWLVLLLVAAVMSGFLGCSFLLDWRRLPRRSTMVFPAMVFAALLTIGLSAPTIAAPLSGLLTGAFVYIGLTQPPGASMASVPCGALTFVVVNGGFSRAITIRLIIAVLVWTMVVEILAAFGKQQRRYARALARSANTDSLTGLPNRRDFQYRIALAAPGDAVVLCDLDHFKRVNDTFGHHVGDAVLADFGALLRAEMRADDHSARIGGEEFVLLLPNTPADDAVAVLSRLRAGWARMRPDVTFSAGVAICRTDRTPEHTLTSADTALYEAKESGRNTERVDTSSAGAGSPSAEATRR